MGCSDGLGRARGFVWELFIGTHRYVLGFVQDLFRMFAGVDQELSRSYSGFAFIWLCGGFLCIFQIVGGSCLECGRDLCLCGCFLKSLSGFRSPFGNQLMSQSLCVMLAGHVCFDGDALKVASFDPDVDMSGCRRVRSGIARVA